MAYNSKNIYFLSYEGPGYIAGTNSSLRKIEPSASDTKLYEGYGYGNLVRTYINDPILNYENLNSIYLDIDIESSNDVNLLQCAHIEAWGGSISDSIQLTQNYTASCVIEKPVITTAMDDADIYYYKHYSVSADKSVLANPNTGCLFIIFCFTVDETPTQKPQIQDTINNLVYLEMEDVTVLHTEIYGFSKRIWTEKPELSNTVEMWERHSLCIKNMLVKKYGCDRNLINYDFFYDYCCPNDDNASNPLYDISVDVYYAYLDPDKKTYYVCNNFERDSILNLKNKYASITEIGNQQSSDAAAQQAAQTAAMAQTVSTMGSYMTDMTNATMENSSYVYAMQQLVNMMMSAINDTENNKTLIGVAEDIASDIAEMKTDINDMTADVDQMNTHVSAITSNTKAMASDVDGINDNIGAIKTDMGTVKTDMGTIKTDMGTVKTDMGTIKSDIADIKSYTDILDTIYTNVNFTNNYTRTIMSNTNLMRDDIATIKENLTEE